ncbi:hypothetical protein [Streptomyces sp. NBC_00078]|uniref:hypothetical protein n=1 Tax=unclassified Streptomyces TaxID=2593676 RepID=UPI00225745E7|nr:hypothetical protein [Streptomyces sp. NBC_00078]MCX5420704.1 hypothetical protein [Streptomyces sp. NBC_00078]
MGALRRIWRRPRGRRVAAAAVLVMTAVGGAVACDPGGLNSAAVAYTTDQTATKELERQKVDVQWLSCTANYGDNKASTGKAAPSASETTVADVDCQGQTKDRREITVTGKVTRAVSGACVRGDLTAKVGGKQWFHVSGLGNCNATPSPILNNPSRGQQPGATVTVTVTKTIWCKGDPQCWPVQGK